MTSDAVGAASRSQCGISLDLDLLLSSSGHSRALSDRCDKLSHATGSDLLRARRGTLLLLGLMFVVGDLVASARDSRSAITRSCLATSRRHASGVHDSGSKGGLLAG